jgi:dTDP-4-dehydrorhamnose reductase
VDKAESDAQAAYAVNRDGPSHLADACREADIPLIHVSTDYVFDGSKSSAYVETDEVAPLGVYGASKEAGERAIRTSLKRHIIIRTAWLYSRHGQNFLKTMLRLAQTRREWGVVADQIGMPTAAADLANAVLAAAKRASRGDAVWGTYHFAGTEEASWHQFASEIVAEWRKYVTCNPAVSPIATDQYPTAARRPKNSRLDSRLFIATFGVSSAPRRLRIASTIKALTQDAAKVQA